MSKQQLYPHAVKYITAEAIAKAGKETLETWEYEASICSAVEIAVVGKDAVGRLRCPKCGGHVFRHSDAVVNYSVPFVSIFRIISTATSYYLIGKAACLTCLTVFPTKKEVKTE